MNPKVIWIRVILAGLVAACTTVAGSLGGKTSVTPLELTITMVAALGTFCTAASSFMSRAFADHLDEQSERASPAPPTAATTP